MYTDKDAVKRVPYDDKSTDRDRDSCIYRKHS
jgi:hypothetical protein